MQMPTVFSEDKRYVFNNWTTEDFLGRWNGVEVLIKAGESREVPEYLALNYCKHLVDREMMKDKQETLMAIDEARLPYEEKTVALIGEGTDSPALSSLKEKIRQEMESEMKAHDVNVAPEVAEDKPAEFDAITA